MADTIHDDLKTCAAHASAESIAVLERASIWLRKLHSLCKAEFTALGVRKVGSVRDAWLASIDLPVVRPPF